jgi:hypothetical protein
MQFLIQFSGGRGVTREILHAKLSCLSCNGFLWLDLSLSSFQFCWERNGWSASHVHSFYISLASPIVFLWGPCLPSVDCHFSFKQDVSFVLATSFTTNLCPLICLEMFLLGKVDVAPWYVVLLSPFHNNFTKEHSIYVVQVSKWGPKWVNETFEKCLH